MKKHSGQNVSVKNLDALMNGETKDDQKPKKKRQKRQKKKSPLPDATGAEEEQPAQEEQPVQEEPSITVQAEPMLTVQAEPMTATDEPLQV